MRVIAGRLGGRIFDSPKGHRTHPMSEKIRGAIFNMLGDISGLTVLDCYCGSGALSIEAVSRGASFAISVDNDQNAHRATTGNIAKLAIDNIKAIRANVSSWSDNNPDKLFDVVLADPPYDDVKPEVLKKLASHTKTGGLVVLSLPPKTKIKLDKFELIAEKNYGDAELAFYRRLK
jgi:16S rRNA (guanine966-N2)-methyltransferase